MAANQGDVASAVQASGVSVFGLQVKDIGGMTAVFGSVASDADKAKAEQAIEAKVGKISNHIEVKATGASTAPAAGAGARTYTVKSGDTMKKISKAMYGDEMQWKKIQAANPDKLKDPDKIQPGWVLNIPG